MAKHWSEKKKKKLRNLFKNYDNTKSFPWLFEEVRNEDNRKVHNEIMITFAVRTWREKKACKTKKKHEVSLRFLCIFAWVCWSILCWARF